MLSKIYIYYEKTLVVRDVSWLDDDQGTFLTAHDVFFIEMENPQIYHYCFFKN